MITIIDESPEKSIGKPLSKKPKLELDIKGEDEIEGTGDKKDMFMGIEEIFNIEKDYTSIPNIEYLDIKEEKFEAISASRWNIWLWCYWNC